MEKKRNDDNNNINRKKSLSQDSVCFPLCWCYSL